MSANGGTVGTSIAPGERAGRADLFLPDSRSFSACELYAHGAADDAPEIDAHRVARLLDLDGEQRNRSGLFFLHGAAHGRTLDGRRLGSTPGQSQEKNR